MSDPTFSLFDLAPGKTVLDRFEVGEPHRHSGLMAAFSATDKDAEGPEATCELVLFPSGLFEGAVQIDEYRASWKPWLRVDSPNVLKVREVLELPQSSLLLVADHPGEVSLRSRMNGDPMAIDEVLGLGHQLLDALIEIHAHGLVHGDIKPQTIYLRGEDASPCLVDGGITVGLWSAKHMGEQTTLIGTPFYAPVEQFGGDAPNVQSDVYAVATVLFELATGVLPWPGKGMLEVFQAKLDKSKPSMMNRAPDVEVAPEVEAAIVGGLMADRRERFASALEFKRALETAVG